MRRMLYSMFPSNVAGWCLVNILINMEEHQQKFGPLPGRTVSCQETFVKNCDLLLMIYQQDV